MLLGGNRIKFFNSRFQSWKKDILLLKQKLYIVLSRLSFKAHSKSLGVHGVPSLQSHCEVSSSKILLEDPASQFHELLPLGWLVTELASLKTHIAADAWLRELFLLGRRCLLIFI